MCESNCVRRHHMTAHLQFSSRLLRVLSPSLRGKARLAKVLLRKHLHVRDVEIHARYDCTFLVPSLAEPIAFHLLTDGVYEGQTLELLLKHLRSGSTFVDVGANIGAFAVPVARRVGVTGRV